MAIINVLSCQRTKHSVDNTYLLVVTQVSQAFSMGNLLMGRRNDSVIKGYVHDQKLKFSKYIYINM